MKLYTGPVSMFGVKVVAAAKAKGVAIEIENVPFNLAGPILYHPIHPEVARINPKAEVPVLIDGSLEIFDSTQILEYFEHIAPEPPLWPASPPDRARARLIELSVDEILIPRLMSLRDAARQKAPDVVERRTAVMDFHAEMSQALADRDYLAGTFSYADIAYFTTQLFAAVMGAPMPASLVALNEWRERVGAHAPVREVSDAILAYLAKANIPPPIYPASGEGQVQHSASR